MTEQQPGPHWYEQQKSQDPNARSVTPAMNNTRGVVRNGAAPYSAASPVNSQYGNNAARSTTPQQRYYGAYNTPAEDNEPPQPPPSTGLIRLTLRKPMGIVFEPMYDPNNPKVQRGVRICDLPRTGAAALSRKLEIGDELLSINDKTMSRLTFDEIMDFIIEADPDQVNLLFRRPRKGALPTRPAPKSMTTPQNASVKWPDDDHRKSKKDKKKSKEKDKEKEREKKSTKRSKRDEDSTVVSQEESLEPRRKYRSSRDMYENESFLDMLIDTICGKPDGYCGDRPRRGDDDYYSDEEDTFASMDDSTYVTYESEQPKARRRSKGRRREDDSTAAEDTEDDTYADTYASPEEEDDRKGRHKKKSERSSKSPSKDRRNQEQAISPKRAGRYEEDEETFEETVEETVEPPPEAAASPPPLGLEPPATTDRAASKEINAQAPPATEPEEDEPNPAAPIAEVEYDEEVDHGADVSVMESLGGPSLLIEKQRQAAKAATTDGPVPAEIVNNFGRDFPADFGLTREQTIQKDPMKFYTYVVKGLLEIHEPEKVRLLDKLLAKYKGREDHLVQKLAVRYAKTEENPTPTIPEETAEGSGFNFTEVVNQKKESAATEDVVKTAKERMATESPNFDSVKWPNNTKDVQVKTEALEEGEEVSMGSESVSGSEYSGDSIDGTSPAVIAQVSELLNYVYGKTSVPGQIDRVSTIMRAYEGREAVLLELLETKALIKANGEKENAADLPSFLRNSPALQHAVGDGQEGPSVDENKPISPLSGPSNHGNGGIVINDDISSMSGVSSPADDENGDKPVSFRIVILIALSQLSLHFLTNKALSLLSFYRRNLRRLRDQPLPSRRKAQGLRYLRMQNQWCLLRQSRPYRQVLKRQRHQIATVERRRRASLAACLASRAESKANKSELAEKPANLLVEE